MTILNDDYTNFVKYCNNEITEYESTKINTIKRFAFRGNSVIERLSFPNVTYVDGSAFSQMPNLEQISLPNVVSFSNDIFFGDSKLTTLNFPNLVSISSYSLSNIPNLTSISIPSCTSIGRYAFADCHSLISLYLPNVTFIESNVFNYCTSLRKIWIPSTCQQINSTDWQNRESFEFSPFHGCDSNCIIYTDSAKPNDGWSPHWNYYDETHQLKVAWNSTYSDYVNDTYNDKSEFENFVDGSTIEFSYSSSVNLVEYHFSNSCLYKISMSEVTNAPLRCFEVCENLKTIDLPNLTTIGEGVFTECSSLTEFDLSNVTSVGNWAFQSCSNLRKVWIPSTCLTLGERIFGGQGHNVLVYTDAEGKLEGWNENWNVINWEYTQFSTVYYNSTYEQYLQA